MDAGGGGARERGEGRAAGAASGRWGGRALETPEEFELRGVGATGIKVGGGLRKFVGFRSTWHRFDFGQDSSRSFGVDKSQNQFTSATLYFCKEWVVLTVDGLMMCLVVIDLATWITKVNCSDEKKWQSCQIVGPNGSQN
jgi:hypothetical protein